MVNGFQSWIGMPIWGAHSQGPLKNEQAEAPFTNYKDMITLRSDNSILMMTTLIVQTREHGDS